MYLCISGVNTDTDSVSVLDTLVNTAKTAEPIEMPFELWNRLIEWAKRTRFSHRGTYTQCPNKRPLFYFLLTFSKINRF